MSEIDRKTKNEWERGKKRREKEERKIYIYKYGEVVTGREAVRGGERERDSEYKHTPV